MKHFFFPIIIIFIAILACGEGKNPSLSDYAPLEKDTVRIAVVDTFMMNLSKTLQTGVQPSSTSFELNDETKEMSYYDLPSGMQQWDATVSADGVEAYATCYLNKEDPWMFRYRAWDTVGTKIVQEIFMYFKDEEIFFAIDRSSDPSSNMNPAQLMQMPFADSKKSKEELYMIFNRYYPAMKESWKNREK